MDQIPRPVTAVVVLLTLSVAGSGAVAGLTDDTVGGTDGSPLAAGASTDVTMVSECRMITEPGRYRLANDIVNSTANRCINIQASDVHFDGAGHTIDGVDKHLFTDDGNEVSTKGVLAKNGPHTNVTVTNVTVTDFGYGLWYGMTTDSRIVNNTFRSNGIYGLYIGYEANDNLIANNLVDETGSPDPTLHGQGIVVANVANRNAIVDNYVTGSERNGIAVHLGNQSLIANNTVIDSGVNGITGVGHDTVIVDNIVETSGNVGIDYGRANRTRITANTVRDNGKGIVLEKSNDVVVSHNTITDNDQHGIHFHGGVTEHWGDIASENATIEANRVTDNGGDGIFLPRNNNDSVLRDNIVSGNGDIGVRLSKNSGNRLVNNTFVDHRIGVHLAEVGGTVLERNTYRVHEEWAVLVRRVSTAITLDGARFGDGSTISVTGRNVAIAGAGASAPPLPAAARALSGVVTLWPETGDDHWAEITIRYDGTTAGDSRIELWLHDGSWRSRPAGAVDRSDERMRTNVTDLEGVTHLVVVATATATDRPTTTTDGPTGTATGGPTGTATATPGQPGFGVAVGTFGLLLVARIIRER